MNMPSSQWDGINMKQKKHSKELLLLLSACSIPMSRWLLHVDWANLYEYAFLSMEWNKHETTKTLESIFLQ